MDTTGGGGHLNKDMDNHRIRVSGNEDLDNAIVHQHEVYKVTGSIEAQARIDSYIMPCIIHQMFGEPYVGQKNDRKGAIRNRIPGESSTCQCHLHIPNTKHSDPLEH